MSRDQVNRINKKIIDLAGKRDHLRKAIEHLKDVQAKSGAEFPSHQARQLEEARNQLDEVLEQIERWENRRDNLLTDLDEYAYTRTEILEISQVMVGLLAPGEEHAHLRIARSGGLHVLRTGWLVGLVEEIREELFLDFDLRRKRENEDLEEIEEWKSQPVGGKWTERRKCHRLRVRTMVDDIFEKSLPLAEVTTSVRAWKIQIVDAFAEAVLERFHLRPASTRPWASHRLQIHDIGKALEQALDYRERLLRSEKLLDARLLQDTISSVHETVRDLVRDIRERDFSRQQE